MIPRWVGREAELRPQRVYIQLRRRKPPPLRLLALPSLLLLHWALSLGRRSRVSPHRAVGRIIEKATGRVSVGQHRSDHARPVAEANAARNCAKIESRGIGEQADYIEAALAPCHWLRKPESLHRETQNVGQLHLDGVAVVARAGEERDLRLVQHRPLK